MFKAPGRLYHYSWVTTADPAMIVVLAVWVPLVRPARRTENGRLLPTAKKIPRVHPLDVIVHIKYVRVWL